MSKFYVGEVVRAVSLSSFAMYNGNLGIVMETYIDTIRWKPLIDKGGHNSKWKYEKGILAVENKFEKI